MKIGIVTASVPGHLNPSSSLGQALKEAGHEVTIINASHRAADIVVQRGLQFASLQDVIPNEGDQYDEFMTIVTNIFQLTDKLADLNGIPAWRLTVQLIAGGVSLFLKFLPDLLQKHNFDALLIDEIYEGGPTSVAEACGIPYGVICNALPLMKDPACPPLLTTWQPLFPTNSNNIANKILSTVYRWRNLCGWYYFGDVDQYFHDEANEYRIAHGLPKLSNNNQFGSRHRRTSAELFYMCQCPSFLDFPRVELPPHFHHTGPWHNLQRDSPLLATDQHVVDLLYKIGMRRKHNPTLQIIYASLGTLQNGIQEIFVNLAKACTELQESSDHEIQLVISLGRKDATLDHPIFKQTTSDDNHNHNTNDVIVIDYCPQLELLKQASVLVTHAGQNTVLEGLAMNGLPMVAIPITNDQPGVAARWARAGIAKIVKPNHASVSNLREALDDVLTNPSYRQAAQKMQKRLQTQAPSLAGVAKLIEVAFQYGKSLEGHKNVNYFPRNHPAAVRILGPPPNEIFQREQQEQMSSTKGTKRRSSTYALFAAAGVIAATATTVFFLSTSSSSSGRQRQKLK